MDEGHLDTERILKEVESDVTRVYRQAAEETEKKLNDYLRRFKTKDQIKRDQLRKGEITKDEYNYWRTGQIMIGKRWEEMKNTLAQDLHNANNIARSIAQGYMPEVYAVNHNYATFQVEKESLVDTSYTLYDRQTVERIIKHQPDLLPPPGPRKLAEIAAGKDIKWQRGQIQSTMMQAILQGESIPHIAKRMAKELSVKNRGAAVRYARTSATGAQNAGRVDGYKRAQGMGIELEQEWLATLDMRTRHEHRYLDGQHVPVGEPFKVDGYDIKFPGDPSAPGYLIWNCRCTLVPHLKNLDQSDAPRKSKLGDMSYEEWKNEHRKVEEPDRQFASIRGPLGDDFVDVMETMLNFTPYEDAKDLFYKFQDKLKVSDANMTKRGAYFSPATGGIHINKARIQQGDGIHKPYQTVFHEFGHNIDYLLGGNNGTWYSASYKNGALEKRIREDYRKFKIKWIKEHPEEAFYGEAGIRMTLSDIGRADVRHALRRGEITISEVISKYGDEMAKYHLKNEVNSYIVDGKIIQMLKDEGHAEHVLGSVSDTIEGILCSRGKAALMRPYPLGVGHDSDYWWKYTVNKAGERIKVSSNNQPLEFFAEVLDGMVANPESYDQMKRIFPGATKMVEIMIKEALS